MRVRVAAASKSDELVKDLVGLERQLVLVGRELAELAERRKKLDLEFGRLFDARAAAHKRLDEAITREGTDGA